MELVLPVVAILVIIGMVFIRYWAALKPGKSIGKATDNALAVQKNNSQILAYTCAYATLGWCELYIGQDGITCKQGNEVLFHLNPGEIKLVRYSYLAIEFVTDSRKYAITKLNKAAEIDTLDKVTALVRARSGNPDKATLDEFIARLNSMGIMVQKGWVNQKHLTIALVAVAFSIVIIILAIVQGV